MITDWAGTRTGLFYIPPRSPRHNEYLESFNSHLHDQCLNTNNFYPLIHTRVLTTDWKSEHNHTRPHSPLDYLTPHHARSAIRPSNRNQRLTQPPDLTTRAGRADKSQARGRYLAARRRANTSLRLFHPGSGSPMMPINAYRFTAPRTAVPGTARTTGPGTPRAPEDTGPAVSPMLSVPARFVAMRKARGHSAPAVLAARGESETSRTLISLLERLLPIIRTGGAIESRVAAAIISRVKCAGNGSFCGIHPSVVSSADSRSAARP